MRISAVTCTAFRLPFRAPFATAHGTVTMRNGTIVRIATDDGRIGLGEASAVPGFGANGAQIAETLRTTAAQLLGRELSEAAQILDGLDGAGPSRAAAAFALDTAVQDLRALEAGVPLTALLGGNPETIVGVNATIGAAKPADAVKTALQAVAAGFRCVKLKAGIAGSEADEIARIEAVREAIGPEVSLRIDANGAWEVRQAIRILQALENAALEFVEQPVDAADLTGMARVRANVVTPVAADESAGGLDQVRRVLEAGAADLLVIKPMLAGRLRRTQEIVALARGAGVGVTVTTTLDTGIGIAAALQLAASLPQPLPACGLATAALLVDDLLTQPLAIVDGTMRIPDRPGLGVSLDEARLAMYTCDSWKVGQ